MKINTCLACETGLLPNHGAWPCACRAIDGDGVASAWGGGVQESCLDLPTSRLLPHANLRYNHPASALIHALRTPREEGERCMSAPERTQVFISYSHEDAEWLRRLQIMLKPLTRNHMITIWGDTQIR